VKSRLAIFDFDDTLFSGQSHGYFISYLEEREPFYKMLLLKLRKRIILFLYGDQNKKCKELLLWPFRGLSQEQFEDICGNFYESVVKKRLNIIVVNEIINKKKEGYLIAVVSGGFDVYLRFFQNEYEIDHVISTKLSFYKCNFLAKIEGEECLGFKKVESLNYLFNSSQVDYNNSVVYTDHISDLPLLNLVGRKIVVYDKEQPLWISADMELLKI